MSALAVLLAGMGCRVSGCDATSGPVLAELVQRGVTVAARHDASHVLDADVVVWSPAVRDDHEELVAARERALVMMARPRVLSELSSQTRVVGVTGTHGKTTATSMLVHIMHAAGRDDSRLVGAPVRSVGFSGYFGAGDLLLEVDESFGAFAELTPYALGLLNVEADHLDHYGSLAALESAFTDVVKRTTGPFVVWNDDPGAARVAVLAERDVVRVGTSDDDQWRLVDVQLSRRGARAHLVGSVDVEIDLAVTGRHNLANAAVAAVVAISLGVDATSVSEGLRAFRGAPRRFDHVAQWRQIDVVEDYAHLPGEIAATVDAAHDAGYERIVAIFQPHRVTRTVSVGAAFAPAFDAVDDVIVTDIYTAGEENPDALTGDVIAQYVRDRGRTRAHYAGELREAAATLERVASDADLILIVGAGDVAKVLNYLPHTNAVREPGVTSAGSRIFGDDPRVIYDAPMGARTTYRVGGTVSALVTLSSLDDLDDVSERLVSSSRPLWVVGNGSNLLIADGSHAAIGVHLEGDFKSLEVVDGDDGRVAVFAGAGLDLPVAARRLTGEGVVGFEWAVGVPGTFGGAVAMNAGGHGSDMRASVRRVEVWSAGQRRWRDADEMAFSYRTSVLSMGDIVTRVELELSRGDATTSRDALSEIVRWRRDNQPGGANAGSVFRNPPGDYAGRLIEAAGAKGLRHGTAVVSEKHANFIIADPDGTAADVLALVFEVRERVAESTGVWLETENRLLGFEETW